jgi:hypothetical protein
VRVALERQAEQRAEVRIKLCAAFARGFVERAAERKPRAQLGVVERDAEPVSQQLAERPVRHRFAVRRAATFQPQQRPHTLGVRECFAQLGDEAALADAGLAGDEHDTARAGAHVVNRGSRLRKLAVAADEARLATRSGRRECAFGDARDNYARLALQLERLLGPPAEEILSGALGLGADEHAAGVRLGLQAGGDIDDVAGCAVFHAAARADGADDSDAAVDANAHAEAVDAEAALDIACIHPQLVADLESGADRAFGVVLVRGRGAEEREHAVAGEILDGAAEGLDSVHDPRHRLPDDQPRLLRIEALGQPGRADQIRAQRRDDPPLLAHRPLLSHRRILAGEWPAYEPPNPSEHISVRRLFLFVEESID